MKLEPATFLIQATKGSHRSIELQVHSKKDKKNNLIHEVKIIGLVKICNKFKLIYRLICDSKKRLIDCLLP